MGFPVVLHPGDQFMEFFGLLPCFAEEHGVGEFADFGSARLAGGTSCHSFEEPSLVEKLIEPAWGVAKDGEFLLEVDIDSAEENRGIWRG